MSPSTLIAATGGAVLVFGVLLGFAAGDLDKKGDRLGANIGLAAAAIFTVAGCLLVWGA